MMEGCRPKKKYAACQKRAGARWSNRSSRPSAELRLAPSPQETDPAGHVRYRPDGRDLAYKCARARSMSAARWSLLASTGACLAAVSACGILLRRSSARSNFAAATSADRGDQIHRASRQVRAQRLRGTGRSAAVARRSFEKRNALPVFVAFYDNGIGV